MSARPSLEGAPAGRAWSAASPPLPPRGVEVLTFDAREASDGSAGVYVASCLATEIPGWVEEARPFVAARVHGLAAHLAGVAASEVVALRPLGPDGLLGVAPVAPGPAVSDAIGTARTFIGFDGARLVTCGATCVRRPHERGAPGPAFCEAALASLRLEGTTAPPPPGLLLGMVADAVQHPSDVVGGACGAAFLLACVAIATRRRPRTRPLPG